jgi:hypothetical protein
VAKVDCLSAANSPSAVTVVFALARPALDAQFKKRSLLEIGQPNRRIAQLDGWRGVSILMVVVGHLLAWHYNSTHNPYDPVLPGFLQLWGSTSFLLSVDSSSQNWHCVNTIKLAAFLTIRFTALVDQR